MTTTSPPVQPDLDTDDTPSEAPRRSHLGPARPDRFSSGRMWTVARTDLKQLVQAKDFWVPMALLGSFFFVIIPIFLLAVIGIVGKNNALQQLANAVQALPQAAQDAIPKGMSATGQVQFMISVYLLAPIAVVVPLTISSAIGASTIVGERERGTGEFLAHSPADTREIFIGKLLASIIPGYVTTAIGFGVYSIIVNVIVGPEVGYWFFPNASWWLLILWVLPQVPPSPRARSRRARRRRRSACRPAGN